MAAAVFTGGEPESLRRFPETGREELSRFFTLPPADSAFIDRSRGPADRLGLAVAVCTLPWLGFVPDDVASALPGTGGPDMPATNIRIGYASCSHLTQELRSQLDALEAHGIPRDKIFCEKVSNRAGTDEVRGHADLSKEV